METVWMGLLKLGLGTLVAGSQPTFTKQDLQKAVENCDVKKVEHMKEAGLFESLSKEAFEKMIKKAQKNIHKVPMRMYPIESRAQLLKNAGLDGAQIGLMGLWFFYFNESCLDNPEVESIDDKVRSLNEKLLIEVSGAYTTASAFSAFVNLKNGIAYENYKNEIKAKRMPVKKDCQKVYELLSGEYQKMNENGKFAWRGSF